MADRPATWRTLRPMSPAMAFCLAAIYPATALMFRLRYRNGDRLPPTGPVLVVVNHISILDPLGCTRFVVGQGRLPRFLAKESVFTGWVGFLLRGAGQIPVARRTAESDGAVDAARAALVAGEVVVIYPEGSVTRDRQWWPMQARTGVARLALTTDAVVLPVAQWGPQRLHDYHARKLHLRLRTPAYYDVGEPVDLSAQRARVRAGEPLSAALLRETTDLIMSRVRDRLAELRGGPAPLAVHPRPVPARPVPADPGSAA